MAYILQNARIVAVLEGGGAIIKHRAIEYEEGRALMYDGDDKDTPQLGFSCSFTVVSSEAPDMVELNRAFADGPLSRAAAAIRNGREWEDCRLTGFK